MDRRETTVEFALREAIKAPALLFFALKGVPFDWTRAFIDAQAVALRPYLDRLANRLNA